MSVPYQRIHVLHLCVYYGRYYGEIANQSNNIFFVFVQQKYINFSLLLLFLAKNVQVQQKVSTTSILLANLLCMHILLSILKALVLSYGRFMFKQDCKVNRAEL